MNDEQTDLPVSDTDEQMEIESLADAVESNENQQRTFSKPMIALISSLLLVGMVVVSVAYAAPNILEPVATSLPDNWFPQQNFPPASYGSDC